MSRLPAIGGSLLAEWMADAGGLSCAWGKRQTDIALTVVQVPLAPSS